MTLSPEQTKQVKEQLIQQIESTFPKDKKAQALAQINSLDDEQLEKFLIQNNLIKEDGSTPEASDQSQIPNQENQKCIFCSIIFGEIPSTKIDENEKAIAVLEINPISKAHSIIIPKDHIEKKEDLPPEALELAQQIAEKIKKTFQPKDIQIANSNMFGHEVINVLPIYGDETPNSPRQKAKPEELTEIQKQLSSNEQIEKPIEQPKEKTKENKTKTEKEINEKNHWLPIRIP